MSSRHITMGAGLLPPQHPVERTEEVPTPRIGASRLVGALAVASPLLFAAYAAVDPATLPREPAAEFLGAIAESRGQFLTATVLQLLSMMTGLALALAVWAAFSRPGRVLPGLAGATLAVGYLGGTGFVGGKLLAADLVADGALRPGAEEYWTTVQSGPFFDVMSWPLLMAIVGTVLVTALLVRERAAVSWWPAPLFLVGFVLSSGELPDPFNALGVLVQLPAVIAIVRHLGRRA